MVCRKLTVNAVWEIASGRLWESNKNTFNQWFSKMVPLRIEEENIVVLGVPDDFFAQIAEQCAGDFLAEALQAVEGVDYNKIPEEVHPNVYISRDKGESWEFYGHTDDSCNMFPEHMVWEKKDGTLGMLIRTGQKGQILDYAESKDGGKTFTDSVPSGIYNPCTRFCIRRLPEERKAYGRPSDRADFQCARRLGSAVRRT